MALESQTEPSGTRTRRVVITHGQKETSGKCVSYLRGLPLSRWGFKAKFDWDMGPGGGSYLRQPRQLILVRCKEVLDLTFLFRSLLYP